MEEFKVNALSSTPHTPLLWLRYVDDTFVIQEAKHSQQLIPHINTEEPYIQFTVEEPNQEGPLPFLDTLVSSGSNNLLVTTVYRKSTCIDQYLYWDGNHFITVKNSVYNALAFRAKVVCTSQQALQEEMSHIKRALQACNFPPGVINTLHNKFYHKHNSHNGHIKILQPNRWTTTTVVPTTKTFPLWYLTSMDRG